MRNEPQRSPSQSQPRPQASRHQFDHQVPTVIHDPEENMMVLARWTHRAMKNPSRFWGTIFGIVAAVLGIVLINHLFLTGSSGRADLWSRLETAKSPGDRVQIAEDNPNSPVAIWARLQAATEFYNQGFADLPNNRDVALPNLKKALDLFDQVAKEAPQDTPPARAAALGKARALEARNELAKAIEQYRLVEKTWPGSPEAEQAKQLAAALEKPAAATFYKELYAYSPTKVTLPPLGTENITLPSASGSSSRPFLGSGSLNAESNPGGLLPSIPLLPPPPPRPITQGDQAPAKAKGGDESQPAQSKLAAGLPESPFAPASPAAAPKAGVPGSAPKPESPKAQPKPAPAPAQAEKPKS
jgi:hypothetical protein